jgi:eukaryotic-like serine/threonine-protein kinase
LYPQIFGKYVLERELSRGGMARVILATLRGAGGFEKKLVVKQIRDELAFDHQFIRRFVEEAKTTVALSHPNIVPVYELGVEEGTYFLAMELVDGVSVGELLRERNEDGSRRVLTPEEGAYIGVEVCRALDYAHRRMKVVHRDITPRNVMIDIEGQIKLIDFGIAAPALVAGHEILGSPGHMAPEQVDGGELGPPTDIFAVAVLLMEAWTGAAPFRRATPEECSAAVREPHPIPSDFDPRLLPIDGAIKRAMSIDPKRRQQEASELARELRSFLQGVDVADLARTLGDRVHDLREEIDSSVSPPSRSTAPRASSASHGDLGTKTFAAREEAFSWSSIPPSKRVLVEDPDDPMVPSTRLLPESTRGPAASVREIRVLPSRADRLPDDPAMAIPTPLMVDVEDLERIHAGIARERESRSVHRVAATPVAEHDDVPTPVAPTTTPSPTSIGTKQVDIPTVRRGKAKRPSAPLEKVETSATRPFETPVRSQQPKTEAAAREKAKSRSRALFAVGAVVVIGGLALWRVRAASTNDPSVHTTNATSTTGSTPSSTPKAAGSDPGIASTNTMPTGSGKKPPERLFASPPVPAPSTSGSAVMVAGKSAVSLQGEPGTRVWVDGAARGSCPTRVALEPGSHEVRFTFDPTSETIVERVTVKSGEQVTVRAQFTGATPTVKVQR